MEKTSGTSWNPAFLCIGFLDENCLGEATCRLLKASTRYAEVDIVYYSIFPCLSNSISLRLRAWMFVRLVR